MGDKRIKDRIEFALGEGKTLLIAVDEDIDPLLDPILEKRVQKKGKSKFIVVADKKMDYNPNFNLLLVTRLPNPQFSPELQAKTTLIDFTVTQTGLEEQLLAHVVGKEQPVLEKDMRELQEAFNKYVRLALFEVWAVSHVWDSTGTRSNCWTWKTNFLKGWQTPQRTF